MSLKCCFQYVSLYDLWFGDLVHHRWSTCHFGKITSKFPVKVALIMGSLNLVLGAMFGAPPSKKAGFWLTVCKRIRRFWSDQWKWRTLTAKINKVSEGCKSIKNGACNSMHFTTGGEPRKQRKWNIWLNKCNMHLSRMAGGEVKRIQL